MNIEKYLHEEEDVEYEEYGFSLWVSLLYYIRHHKYFCGAGLAKIANAFSSFNAIKSMEEFTELFSCDF